MEEMLIINPRRGARGRFVKNSRKRRHRRRNPIAALAANPRRRRRRNPIAALAVNPRRRRRRNPIAAVTAMNPRRRRHRRHSAVRSTRRRRYSNPRGGSIVGSFKPRAILNALIPAGIGAIGAIGLDIAMSYVPLPAQFQSGLWKNVARIVGAVGLGVVAGMVVGRQKGQQVALGAMTVATYTIIRDVVKEKFPQLNLSGAESYDYSDLRLGYTNPAAMLTGVNGGNGMGAYMNAPIPSGVGAYMRGSLDSVNSLSGVTGDGL